jgi:hypothetical protein
LKLLAVQGESPLYADVAGGALAAGFVLVDEVLAAGFVLAGDVAWLAGAVAELPPCPAAGVEGAALAAGSGAAESAGAVSTGAADAVGDAAAELALAGAFAL